MISDTYSFLSDEKVEIDTVYKIYVTVVLTFLQRSSKIHMLFFYDSPIGKKKKGKKKSSVVIQRVI